ncbi:hypothetical protein ACQ4LE_010762 [Meloidogyne hapla]|uniref:Uncharacterized protein n=1 Tax=Meloidogyne hapla TaxID=6305 RepID=A0A1I8BA08_MELHA
MILLILTAIVWQINAQQQPPYFPPQNINGTFGLQLNSYPSPQHLLQYQRQLQPSDYRQQQYAPDGHYLHQQPQFNNHYPNSFQTQNKWQNDQKLEDEDSKEENNNNFLSQNNNNRQYPQRVHFDPNNNLPYLHDRQQQQRYNQMFNGGYNHLTGQKNPSSFDFENEADPSNSPYNYGNQQRPVHPNMQTHQYNGQQHPAGPLNPHYRTGIVYPEGQRNLNNHKSFWFNDAKTNNKINNFWLLTIFGILILYL